jgi:hypothetical protein
MMSPYSMVADAKDQVSAEPTEKVYTSMVGKPKIHEKDGRTERHINLRVDSDPAKPIIHVASLDDISVPISQAEAIARAKSLWMDGGLNLSSIKYLEAHPAGSLMPDDLAEVMVPDDPEEAKAWVKRAGRISKTSRHFELMNYIGDELVQAVQLFINGGYIIEDPTVEQPGVILDQGLADIQQILLETPTTADWLKWYGQQPDFRRRFLELVFFQAIRYLRRSFTREGVIRQIIVTDVDIAKVPKLIEGQTKITDWLLAAIVPIEETPLLAVLTDKDGTLSCDAILGRDALGNCYADRLRL